MRMFKNIEYYNRENKFKVNKLKNIFTCYQPIQDVTLYSHPCLHTRPYVPDVSF